MKNRIQTLISSLIVFLTIALFLDSCKPDEHKHGQENVTTIRIKLVKSGSNQSLTYSFRSLGGNVTKDTIILESNSTYSASIQLLDESKSPAEDLTPEIKEESNDHQFFYIPSPSDLIEITNLDKDKKGMNFGLNATWKTFVSKSGTLKIVLKHYHGNKSNDPAKGETDIEILFDVIVR
ncbi:MAG: hypothetical protein RMJ53_08180 [Chitinophagales bacterium]|nr:hypothetical protein [Chitinophagales bacterium]